MKSFAHPIQLTKCNTRANCNRCNRFVFLIWSGVTGAFSLKWNIVMEKFEMDNKNNNVDVKKKLKEYHKQKFKRFFFCVYHQKKRIKLCICDTFQMRSKQKQHHSWQFCAHWTSIRHQFWCTKSVGYGFFCLFVWWLFIVTHIYWYFAQAFVHVSITGMYHCFSSKNGRIIMTTKVSAKKNQYEIALEQFKWRNVAHIRHIQVRTHQVWWCWNLWYEKQWQSLNFITISDDNAKKRIDCSVKSGIYDMDWIQCAICFDVWREAWLIGYTVAITKWWRIQWETQWKREEKHCAIT